MRRRTFLAGAGLGGLVAACGRDDPTQEAPVGDETIRYGDDPSQFVELSRPSGGSRGVVAVIHGGFWKAQYDASLGRPLATALVEEGWTAANVEYRRVGNGGGVPETLDDVAAALDALADVDGIDTTRVVTLGHSAGGQLAVWAAARGRFDRWRDPRVAVTAAVSQAGVLDLVTAYDLGLGSGAVAAFVGAPPGDGYAEVDPLRQLPLDVPVRCVHGSRDDIVPIAQSRAYVDAAVAAGADATLTEVEGDHFVVIDPASPAWTTTLDLLDTLP